MPVKSTFSSIILWKKQLVCLGVASLLLAGCGGSESDDVDFLGGSNDINVALASTASASASYDPNSASNVIDGDTTSTTDWAGIAEDDSVQVNFGKLRYLKEIKIFTNDSSPSNKRIEISTDNVIWKTTGRSSGVDVPCTTYMTTNASVTSTASITCSYSSRQQAVYVKFTTLTTDLLNVYEIQAIGY